MSSKNIELSDGNVEYHPLKPFLPEGCKVLFLGSFPPQRKRWAKDFCFFYPNFINDHWRIEGLLFFGDKNHFVDTENKTFKLADIVAFLEEKGIGFYDTATAVRRLKDNASDKFLEVVEKTDIAALLKSIPECRVIVTTGEKATATICETLSISKMPKVGEHVTIHNEDLPQHDIALYRLPSSSRAYPLSLDKKAEAYSKMFAFAGII
ncbi:MAG: uracil-DNA glycosylase family protein [Prevotellaceae bacterium]|nr:uracil-DNA glycosylase family protein [Candidatus Minthosoma equi]